MLAFGESAAGDSVQAGEVDFDTDQIAHDEASKIAAATRGRDEARHAVILGVVGIIIAFAMSAIKNHG